MVIYFVPWLDAAAFLEKRSTRARMSFLGTRDQRSCEAAFNSAGRAAVASGKTASGDRRAVWESDAFQHALRAFERTGRESRRREIHALGESYDRCRDLPRDFGVYEVPTLAEPEKTKRLVRIIGRRIHYFIREGHKYEPWALRPMILKRLRVALAGELRNLRALRARKEEAA